MRSPPLAVALVAATLVAGCGSGERDFEAGEFVEEANEAGAGFELGEPLTSASADTEVYALRLSEGSGAPGVRDAPHSGGSLTVTGGTDAAQAEFARCEQAVSLICFRAANVVVIFEDEFARSERSRVEAAFQALETD